MQRIITLACVGIIILTCILTLAFCGPANAHDWYDGQCCSGTDCREAMEGELSLEKNGVRINPTGELIPYSDPRIRKSKDGTHHRCLTDPQNIKSHTLCIYLSFGV